jgi:hypothetical protein
MLLIVSVLWDVHAWLSNTDTCSTQGRLSSAADETSSCLPDHRLLGLPCVLIYDLMPRLLVAHAGVCTHKQAKDRQIRDMEDVIFYLQDEIIKTQKTAADTQIDVAAMKPVVSRLDAGNVPATPGGRGGRGVPSRTGTAAVRK